MTLFKDKREWPVIPLTEQEFVELVLDNACLNGPYVVAIMDMLETKSYSQIIERIWHMIVAAKFDDAELVLRWMPRQWLMTPISSGIPEAWE